MHETSTDIRKITLSITQHYALAITTVGLLGILAFFFPLFAYVSGMLVGLIALQEGLKKAFIVAAGAILLVGLIAFFSPPKVGVIFPLLFVLWFPHSICAWVLRETRSQSAALLIVGACATLWIVSMHLLTGDVVIWWKHWLEQHVTMVSGATVKGFIEEGSLPFINGIVTMFLGSSLMLTLLLARKWQMFLHHSKTFRAEFHALALPRILALPVISLALLVIMGIVSGKGTLWGDLLMVATMMYLFQGLAILYALVAAIGASAWWVAPVYVGLLILPVLLVQGLALIGVASSVADFRPSHFSPPPPGDSGLGK